MLEQLVTELVMEHEGLRLKPYDCGTGRELKGKITIGYGRNLEDVGISEDEALLLLERDVRRTIGFLSRFDWWRGLSIIRRAVFADMCFQLGEAGVLGFSRTIAFVRAGDFEAAGLEMLDSKWAVQTPNRAERLAQMMVVDAKCPYRVN